MRSSFLGFFLICLVLPVFAQTKQIDELKRRRANVSSDSLEIELSVKLAKELNHSGHIQKAITVLKKAASVADSLEDAHLVQEVDIQQADNYLNNSQPDSAEKILSGVLKRYPESEKKAVILSLLGNAYRYMGNYKQALKKQQQAKALVDSAQQPKTFSRINLNLGSVHSETGNYGLAFKYFLRSIAGARAVGDSLLLATSLNNIGLAYNNYSKPDKAKYYLQRAEKIDQKNNNKVGLLRASLNLAIVFHQLHELDKAIKQYNEALDLHKAIRKDVPPYQILYNLGQVYKDKNDLDKAADFYHQSLEYCKKAGISQGLVYNYGGLANVAELRKNFSQARDYYTKALYIAQKIGVNQLQKSALHSLYNLEKEQKNYKEALTYHEKFKRLSDSLKEQANEQKIKQSEMKLALSKQQKINQLLEEKQEQQKARIRTENGLIAAGLGIIVIISVLVILLYRANKQKKRINAKLESRSNELEDLNKIKDKILAIIAHDLRSPFSSMQGMIYLLREDELSDEEIDKMTAELEVSISQNVSMMDNLLAWAREQMSGLALNIESIEAYDITEEVLGNYEFQAQHKGIHLSNNVDKGQKVKADYNLFKLVLRNLVSNGIKFCENGDHLVVKASESGDEIIFEVKDTGVGIPDEKKADLFTIDSGSRAGTNNEKGSGLGLLLCKEFVEKQQGKISVKSTVGVGTTFIFSLPRIS